MNDCALYGGMPQGEFLEGIKSYVQYGANLSSLLVNLNMDGLSTDHLHKTIGTMFGIPLSSGTVINKLALCASKLTDTGGRIKGNLIDSKVVHFDETGTRICGKTEWVHSSSNKDGTYLTFDRKRGVTGMKTNGVLPDFRGTAGHDYWKPYWKFKNVRHAVCGVHILRGLNGVIDNHPEQEWAKKFKALLLEMLEVRKQHELLGKETMIAPDIHGKLLARYDKILELVKKENHPPEISEGKRGRKKRGKVLVFIDRLTIYKCSVILFTQDFSVPFSNNTAEQ